MSRTKGRGKTVAAVGVLAAVFALGVAVPALVAPALADDPPTTTEITPTTTTTVAPNPDPAPKPQPAPAPAPKKTTSTTTAKAPTQPKPAPAPAPAPAPTTQAVITTPSPAPVRTQPLAPTTAPAPVKHLSVTTKKPKTHRKARAKHRIVRPAPSKSTHRAKPASAARATPAARTVGLASTGDDHASSARMLLLLLLIVPALLLLAVALPVRAVPQRLAIGWLEHRMEIGMLAGSLLLIDALLYVLAG